MASLTPYTGNLGLKNAAHLLRRASFGGTRKQIDEFATKTVDEALIVLSQTQSILEKPIDPLTGTTWLNPKADPDINSEQSKLIDCVIAWHLEQIRKSGTNLTERMVWFYHTHLPVQRSIVRSSEEIYYQNALFRFFAYGNFKKLMVKISIDNAMLRYIDNMLNEADSPNENYARELMELYTIGKGPQIGHEDYTNYTEDDVKQAARVLSGYKTDPSFTNIDQDTGIPRGVAYTDADDATIYHDAGVKTFTSKFNNTIIQPNDVQNGYATKDAMLDELSQFINMIFTQDETARFICRKIYRQFIYYKITDEIEADIIEPLAQTFRDNNFDILPVITQLLKSQHFYDMDNATTPDDHIGAMIKSPVELVMGTLKFFNISPPNDYYQVYNSIVRSLFDQGIDMYEPIDVAGYPAYHQYPTYNRFWITPNNLPHRYKFAADLVNGNFTNLKLDIVDYVKNTDNISNPADADILLTELIDYLFPQDIPQERYEYFMSILLDTLTKDHWKTEWNDYVSNGDDTVVRTQLEALIKGLLQTPEYQLM